MANSLNKYIRKEKARIRREILDTKSQQEAIKELYKKHYDNPGNIQPSGK